MLQSLRVKNLAIVETVQVEFGDGLNVVTGETGAGKSVIVGALGLILGGRADRNMLRAGANRCSIEAAFALQDPAAINALLADLDIEPCEDGILIIRRSIAASGTGKHLINDCPATVQALKKLGNLLVDMHGPHDHQSLLSQDAQLDILDSFGHLWTQRAAYEALYAQRLALQAQRSALDGDDQEVAQQIDLLRYQVQEIEDAALTDEDEGGLEKEHQMVANAQRILELAGITEQALLDDEAAAFNAMVASRAALQELATILDDAAAWRDEAESIIIQMQELAHTVADHVQRMETDPERLQWLEDRMALLHRLKRKYGNSVAEILAFHARTAERLTDLESRGQRLGEIDALLSALEEKLIETGKRLGKKRRSAAKKMGEAITSELHDLGFAHGTFEVTLDTDTPRPSGLDTIEFGFAPNIGEPMRALRAIASSGEISRVMLATKAVLAAHDKIPVLVFDEIDANVGGEMGSAIGNKLAAVATNHQVLCITHLPQVAVQGDHHLVVTKQVSKGRTTTGITPVSADDRAEEIARMLGGRDLTSVTLDHAREMLANA